MEKLQQMLLAYNNSQEYDICDYGSWYSIYNAQDFPKYWKIIYKLAERLPRDLTVLEIGSGLGLVTSIFLYLGFEHICSFERDGKIANLADNRLFDLFRVKNIVCHDNFDKQECLSDLLIMVNCVYTDGIANKDDYLNKIYSIYNQANKPKYILLEVIDDSFKETDSCFPDYVRLSKNDIEAIFPDKRIDSWETYKYPINKRSKTLYYIH